MINIKKMDEKDFVFISNQADKEEEAAFSLFLKTRKKQSSKINIIKRLGSSKRKSA